MSEIVPAGRYVARVNGSALVETKSGEEKFAVEFVIVEGDHAGSYVVARYGFSSDAQTDLTFSQLRHMGWVGTDLSRVTLDPNALHTINVKHRVVDGKVFVDALVQTGGVSKFELAPEKAKSFAARMAARVKAYDAKNGAAHPPPAALRAPAQREPGDDDIPF